LHELDLYVVVQACAGLDAGLYRYDPERHRLGRLLARLEDVGALARDAAGAAMMAPEHVQVLVVVSARFARLAWKYSGIAYSLILKDVGVLYQTMYLVATAMGLAPCALGAGDSDLFARAIGSDYYAETSVGEFLLGSRP
jgi:SagB-type dehydrogenase family enzyme